MLWLDVLRNEVVLSLWDIITNITNFLYSGFASFGALTRFGGLSLVMTSIVNRVDYIGPLMVATFGLIVAFIVIDLVRDLL